MHMKRFTASMRGMSIIEMIIYISITALIIGAVVISVIFFYRSNTTAMEQSLHINHARKGIDSMVRDIREATYGDEGSFPLIELGAYNFSFFSDIDRDDYTERIRYYVVGNNLYKGVTNPNGNPLWYNNADEVLYIVSEAVRNEEEGTPIFRYYDDTGTEIVDYSNLSEVSFVTVTLVININVIRKPDEYTLRSSATIRNLKTNL